MEPLYERLLKRPFSNSVSAIEYCRSVCAEFGFTVKQEASANRVKKKYDHFLQNENSYCCLCLCIAYIEHLCILFQRRIT